MDTAICASARAAFDCIQFFNRYRPNPSFTPKWADQPLLKSWEKSKPKLGWPRETDWLCPKCVVEAREKILDNATQIKPRRQMSVQFSGGEPTLSPHFLRAIRYARKVGYSSVQTAMVREYYEETVLKKPSRKGKLVELHIN
jgi:MoaA/NifB/PqqE/SkfB family radical SAM enzyme